MQEPAPSTTEATNLATSSMRWSLLGLPIFLIGLYFILDSHPTFSPNASQIAGWILLGYSFVFSLFTANRIWPIWKAVQKLRLTVAPTGRPTETIIVAIALMVTFLLAGLLALVALWLFIAPFANLPSVVSIAAACLSLGLGALSLAFAMPRLAALCAGLLISRSPSQRTD
jgi:hypothetical protein